MTNKILALFALLLSSNVLASPSLLILKNQFGEQSNNNITGPNLPLAGTANVVIMTGATAPVNGGSGTGANAAALGSLYVAQDTGALYQNTNTKASPTWVNVLGAVANGTFTPTSETLTVAGAISTTKMESILSNAGGSTYAATLAAPSSQDGQIKILKMGTATHTVTVAMTNIAMSGSYTPTGTTTLTFTAAGDSAVFMAVGSKWVYLGGSAIAS